MIKTLPQVCRKCRMLKMPSLGEFKKVPSRCHDWYWICHACQPPHAPTVQSPSKASWLERKVIPVLAASGYRWVREFELGPFRFDFALPKLWLLIEADSSWHRHASRQHRDRAKDALAEGKGWLVARVRDPDIEGWTRRAIDRRAEDLLELPAHSQQPRNVDENTLAPNQLHGSQTGSEVGLGVVGCVTAKAPVVIGRLQRRQCAASGDA